MEFSDASDNHIFIGKKCPCGQVEPKHSGAGLGKKGRFAYYRKRMALPDPSQSSGIYIGVRGILGDEKNGSDLPAIIN